MKTLTDAERIIASRWGLVEGLPVPPTHKAAEEGGCGVVGLAASVQVAGRHLIAPARQMHNRGNGKGGGIAAAGLSQRAVDLVRYQAEPRDPEYGPLFHAADEAS